jgi:hypothetical protein
MQGPATVFRIVDNSAKPFSGSPFPSQALTLSFTIDDEWFKCPGEKMVNQLYYGDNLQVVRDSIATESIDLVYLDPPFNSQANYNVLFKAPTGERSKAQIEAA